MKRIYLRFLPRCRTVNEVNRLHGLLENRMTPMEAAGVGQAIPAVPFYPVRKQAAHLRDRIARRFGFRRQPAHFSNLRRIWTARSRFEKLDAMIRLSGKTEPEPFERRRLPRGIRLYTAGGNRSLKTLIVGYTGNARRFMMPLPVFLQHLDATKVDVAVFYTPKGEGYRSGVARIADTLPASIEAMRNLLEMDKYDSVVAYGVSGGGIPAVITTLQLGLDTVMTTGCNNPDDPRWSDFNGTGLRNTINQHLSNLNGPPSMYLVFGAQSPPDRHSAETLAEIVPAQLIAVDDPNGEVTHNALFPLVQQGKFSTFLDRTIFSERELKHQ